MSRGNLATASAVRVAVVAAAFTAALGASTAPLVMEADRYNDTYTGLEVATQPIVRGPLVVRLSSPRFDLTVLANRLELAPAGACRHDATVWARFSGDGELVADVELGAFPARFEDRVRIPEQENEITARITVEPAGEGWAVTLEELPESTTVEIESEIAGRLVGFCRRVSLFVAGDSGCNALDRLLSHPRLPLPEPGTRFVVRRDELTAAERRRLQRYLAAENGCPPAAGGS